MNQGQDFVMECGEALNTRSSIETMCPEWASTKARNRLLMAAFMMTRAYVKTAEPSSLARYPRYLARSESLRLTTVPSSVFSVALTASSNEIEGFEEAMWAVRRVNGHR